jgi:hypothetical protein
MLPVPPTDRNEIPRRFGDTSLQRRARELGNNGERDTTRDSEGFRRFQACPDSRMQYFAHWQKSYSDHNDPILTMTQHGRGLTSARRL